MSFSELIEVTNSPAIVDKATALQMLQENAERLSSTQHPFIQTDMTILEDNDLSDCESDRHLLIEVSRQIPMIIYQDDQPVLAAASCIFNIFADAVYCEDKQAYTSIKVDTGLLMNSDYLNKQIDSDEVTMVDFKINDTVQEDQDIIALMQNLLFTIDDAAYINELLETHFLAKQTDIESFVIAIHKIDGLQFSQYYKVVSPFPLKDEDEHLYKSMAYSGMYGVCQDFAEDFDSPTAQYTKPFDALKLSTPDMVDWDYGISLVRLLVRPLREEDLNGDPLMTHHLKVSKQGMAHQDKKPNSYGYASA